MLGADGILVGTRFWASREALVPEGFHKDAIVANGDGTVRTILPDIARQKDWPAPFTIRTLESDWIKQWQDVPGGPASEDARAEYVRAALAGDGTGAAGIAGEAVGLISDIPGAGEIVERMMREAEATLGRWSGSGDDHV